MGEAGPAAALARFARQVGRWPALARDAGAAALALWAVCIGDLLIVALPGQAALLLVLPGVVLGALVFGWLSALLALLVAALAVHWIAPSPQGGVLGAAAWELTVLLAVAMALACGLLVVRLWARQRERRAALLLDACANDALSRIAEAERRLSRAEEDAAEARTGLDQAQRELSRSMARREPVRDGIEEALRREGGV
jgi:K+-sensing histidine kinase KdpD